GGRQVPDSRVLKGDRCPAMVAPSLEIQAHSAPLGLAFYTGQLFPAEYRGSLFVAYHGSWNRTIPTGYKVCGSRSTVGRRRAARISRRAFPPGVRCRRGPSTCSWDATARSTSPRTSSPTTSSGSPTGPAEGDATRPPLPTRAVGVPPRGARAVGARGRASRPRAPAGLRAGDR